MGNAFGKRLRKIRRAKGLSLRALGRAARVNPGGIARVEGSRKDGSGGNAGFQFETLLAVLRALEVPGAELQWLLFGEGETPARLRSPGGS